MTYGRVARACGGMVSLSRWVDTEGGPTRRWSYQEGEVLYELAELLMPEDLEWTTEVWGTTLSLLLTPTTRTKFSLNLPSLSTSVMLRAILILKIRKLVGRDLLKVTEISKWRARIPTYTSFSTIPCCLPEKLANFVLL